MTSRHTAADARAVRASAHELTGAAGDFDVLLDRIGDAGCVLLGESTHGTAQFYAVRAHVTKRLIEERGFRAVAVEADWPDALRASRWAGGAGHDLDAAAALGDVTRFPRWMWRNREVEQLLAWLREHNAAGAQPDVGFYGLDLSSPPGGRPSADAPFFAEQDVRLHRNAERYHRARLRVGPESWNLRDRHMAETLDALRGHLAASDGRLGKVVVWAHNSHAGDARATEQAELGELSLGQLAREAYGDDAVLVGLSTYEGSMTAAPEWGGPATTMPVEPAREDSHEALLHDSGPANVLLVMGAHAGATATLERMRLQRAIGAVFRPERERFSHYVFADVTRQFDALIHLDVTSALEPLDADPGDLPETFPTGV
jgi:erythromycin esterase-like protein